MTAVRTGKIRFFPPRTKTYLGWPAARAGASAGALVGASDTGLVDDSLLADPQVVACWNDSADSVSLKVLKDRFFGFPAENSGIWAQIQSGTDGRVKILICVAPGNESFESALNESGTFEQDPDVLDTWFSSALWPHATLGWPDQENNPPLNGQPDPSGNGKNTVLPYFYPGSVLITSRDIITLWVARMVIMGLYNMGDIPFRHVHVHPKILDGSGRRCRRAREQCDPWTSSTNTASTRSFHDYFVCHENQDVRLPAAGYECPHCGRSFLRRSSTRRPFPPAQATGEMP